MSGLHAGDERRKLRSQGARDGRRQARPRPSDPEEDWNFEPLTPEEEAEEARLDAQAEADIEASRFVSHERVVEWLLQLSEGKDVPPPEP